MAQLDVPVQNYHRPLGGVVHLREGAGTVINLVGGRVQRARPGQGAGVGRPLNLTVGIEEVAVVDGQSRKGQEHEQENQREQKNRPTSLVALDDRHFRSIPVPRIGTEAGHAISVITS
jgi:hypothetical protein